MLENVFVVYFSPTGGTRRTALFLSEELAEHHNEIDLSLPEESVHAFGKGDVVIFASPVFGGRIPAYVVEKLKNFRGDDTKAVTAVVYGNRAYDDAMLELNDCVKAQGFRVAASVGTVSEHSMIRTVAAGRPDEQDYQQLKKYAKAVLEKLENGGSVSDLNVPGKQPFAERRKMPVVPAVSDACNKCGLCAEKCPAQAISMEDPKMTDPSKCMLCMRCIAVCPEGARSLPAQVQGMLEQKLSPLNSIRREIELYL